MLACAGDIATLETLAAAWWLRRNAPGLQVRVVNVVDLMALYAASEHPHGMADDRFADLFTDDVDVVFAFHGYPGAVHQVIHRRPNPARFHVRGYREEGTTTTPFDMVVLNETSRFHLAIEALRRARRPLPERRPPHRRVPRDPDAPPAYVREHFEDLPEIRDWTWTSP